MKELIIFGLIFCLLPCLNAACLHRSFFKWSLSPSQTLLSTLLISPFINTLTLLLLYQFFPPFANHYYLLSIIAINAIFPLVSYARHTAVYLDYLLEFKQEMHGEIYFILFIVSATLGALALLTTLQLRIPMKWISNSERCGSLIPTHLDH